MNVCEFPDSSLVPKIRLSNLTWGVKAVLGSGLLSFHRLRLTVHLATGAGANKREWTNNHEVLMRSLSNSMLDSHGI